MFRAIGRFVHPKSLYLGRFSRFKFHIFCLFFPVVLSFFQIKNHSWDMYGELLKWSKRSHSKSSGHLVVSSPQNPYRIRLFAGSNNWIFCCSTLEFYPKVFPFKRSFWGRKSGEHTWRRIEVVITGLTRNQLTGNRPWVRIPPSPPIWLENTTFSSLFLHFFEVFRNFLFTMVLQAGENLG